MEKISLKPTSQEIIIKGAATDGHMDIFSYDTDAEISSSKLGSLYVIGNVVHDNDDASYIINLVASLAKREYYSKNNLPLRDAFSATLKKINEVVVEFFKNKELKISMGIFAIANEQILISKLGKFKIILSRDSKNIDILNNIELFNKEHIEEKEFSNIISGRVKSGDKILAFYPNKSITSREKSIKDNFLKLGAEQFAEKIQELKGDKGTFGCALLCVSLSEHKEILSTPKIVHESKPLVREVPKTTEEKDTVELSEKPLPAPSLVRSDKARKPRTVVNTHEEEAELIPNPIPQIIPSEFSLGRKHNLIANLMQKTRSYRGNQKVKIFLAVCAAILVIGGALTVKSFFFRSPELKALNQKVQEAQANVKVAKTKITQNDLLSARRLLLGSLAALNSSEAKDSPKAQSAKAELIEVLDDLDKAEEVAPELIYQVSAEIGEAALVSSAGIKTHVYVSGKDSSGNVLTIENKELKDTSSLSAKSPKLLFSNDKYVSLVDSTGVKTLQGGKTNNSEINLASALDYDIYEGNLYILSPDRISKVSDAVNGSSALSNWLNDPAQLITNPFSIVADGKIFILNESGVVATYYKNQKSSEANTLLAVTPASLLLTAPDSNYLYIFDSSLGRVHKISKDSGTIERTVKIGSDTKILNASLGSNDKLYFISSDNKIWAITM